MGSPLQQLSDAGVAVWLDDISRQRLRSGNLAELIAQRNVVGVTSNPTIFAKALARATPTTNRSATWPCAASSVKKRYALITTYDVRWACDVLRPVYDATDGVDGRVSIEVDPRLAHDTGGPSPRPGRCGGWSTGPT